MKKNVSLILSDIRSIHNVGSIFRTADCAGISKIYLAGYTPAPVDRFGRARRDFAKVSLGAEKTVAWEAVSDIKKLISKLKKEKIQIIAVEQSKNSIDYRKVKPTGPTAILYGNEVGGVPKDVLKLCDVIAEIPLHGEKESLNVSVSVGVSLFRFI
jgi:tRNA G18 (ribose-2'-O)-methylase SpoU